MSERRACAVIGADRTSIRYRSRRPDDADLRERLRALAPNAAGSATGGCMFCCAGRGMS
jgi:small ligand-binding sensory domain FIST